MAADVCFFLEIFLDLNSFPFVIYSGMFFLFRHLLRTWAKLTWMEVTFQTGIHICLVFSSLVSGWVLLLVSSSVLYLGTNFKSLDFFILFILSANFFLFAYHAPKLVSFASCSFCDTMFGIRGVGMGAIQMIPLSVWHKTHTKGFLARFPTRPEEEKGRKVPERREGGSQQKEAEDTRAVGKRRYNREVDRTDQST